MNEICVVYLARAQNGLPPFQSFLDSYRRHAAGREHDLLIVFKGFPDPKSQEPLRELAAEFSPLFLSISDFGYDLRAYRLAARAFSHRYYCLLNSFSEILAGNWLEIMHRAIQETGVGLVGATGSCESMYSNVLAEAAESPGLPCQRKLALQVRTRLCSVCFKPFPNYHLRTNGLMIPRELMLEVWPRVVLTKRGCYLFENGKSSLTRRVERLKLKPVLVGRDGKSYEKATWSQSRTFRLGAQENLLIADNQTRLFSSADPARRAQLTRLAWG